MGGPTHYLLYNNLSVIGASIDVHSDHRYEQIVEGVKVWFNLYQQGKIRPNIMVTCPLEEFKQAFDLIVGCKVRGKIVPTDQPKIRSED